MSQKTELIARCRERAGKNVKVRADELAAVLEASPTENRETAAVRETLLKPAQFHARSRNVKTLVVRADDVLAALGASEERKKAQGQEPRAESQKKNR